MPLEDVQGIGIQERQELPERALADTLMIIANGYVREYWGHTHKTSCRLKKKKKGTSDGLFVVRKGSESILANLRE